MNKYSRNCDNPLGYVTRRLKKTHDIKQCKCFSCRHKPLRRIRPIKIHEFVCSTVINTYIKTNPLILRLFEQQNKKNHTTDIPDPYKLDQTHSMRKTPSRYLLHY